MTKVYEELARSVDAYQRSQETDNGEWQANHEYHIKFVCENDLPHGSGFDNGCWLSLEESRPQRLVIHADYHPMGETGMYDAWEEYRIIVKPLLMFGFDLRCIGPARDRDYVAECLSNALGEEYKP